jgi:5-formyltetrahydrofolate cyclo-ligase
VNKKELRKDILTRRSAMTQEDVRLKSELICASLINSDPFSKARALYLYSPIRKEVETRDIFLAAKREGKRVGFPVSLPRSRDLLFFEVTDLAVLKKGAYNIPEPPQDERKLMTPETVDCIIVPGVAFDERGYRLGYGGGYYDRLLKKSGSRVITIGLAFDLQVIPRIPTESHDSKMDNIFTESRIIACSFSDMPIAKEV